MIIDCFVLTVGTLCIVAFMLSDLEDNTYEYEVSSRGIRSTVIYIWHVLGVLCFFVAWLSVLTKFKL